MISLFDLRQRRFDLNFTRHWTIYGGVNRLKPLVALIVLTLWASCAIRCEVACLTGSSALACCCETDDDCGGKPATPVYCVCNLLQAGACISENTGVQLPQSVGLVIFLQPEDWQVPIPDVRVTEMIFPPAELFAGWQFTFRTAAPPRAPSFVS